MCWIVFAGVPAGRRAGGGGNSAAGKETAQHTLVELEFIHLWKCSPEAKQHTWEKRLFCIKFDWRNKIHVQK